MKRLFVIFCCAAAAVLHAADQAAEKPAAATPTAAELNKIAGTPLFGETELWQERPSSVTWRLNVNCRAEKSGKGQMFAAPLHRQFFGCPAAELRIFAVDSKVTRIDVFLVNKGDSALDSRRRGDIKSELRRNRSGLEKLLRENFGRSHKVSFGSGSLRRQLPMWTCGRYAFLIDWSDGEYLIFRLVPPESLAEKRRGAAEHPEARKNFAANVKRSSNGDVFIDDVPMVNQGRKGYCVPATVERLLRYFGVSGVDMHQLAEKYRTGVGGNTRADRMFHGSRQLLGDYGLRLREVGGLKRHAVVKYVDQGIPVLWFHYSDDAFQERINFSLVSRKRATPEGWKKRLADQKRLRRSNKGAHVALLIGYNRDTDEFAVSNSWGERYRIAWVRFADMEQVDARMDLCVVVPRK